MNIKPFRGLRPVADRAAQVASRPYDVLNTQEARHEVQGNPLSFLHVVKPEINLPPDTDPHDPAIYEASRRSFSELIRGGVFIQDESECLYLYELTREGRVQDGIVAVAAVDDYVSGKVKKHELTRPDKENDRKTLIRVTEMDAEPVLFAYRSVEELNKICTAIKKNDPEYSFEALDGVGHRFWVVTEERTISEIVKCFKTMPATYVADGHHRTAAAANVGADMRRENTHHTGKEPYNYFLAVHFPDDQLTILDYNRVVSELNGHSVEDFKDAVATRFDVESRGAAPYLPARLHEFSMYLAGTWYRLSARPGTFNEKDPVDQLDVSILSKQLLGPILDIRDLRTDKRIDFVGGARGLEELQRRVDSGEMKAAFALYPVSMKQLMAIADSGEIMPPKTTWFEPKLRSGLIVYSLEP